MILLFAVEFLFAAIFIVVVVTQILLPIMMSKPIFPSFRGSVRTQAQVADVLAEIDAAKTEREIRSYKDIADNIRKGNQ